MRTDQPRVLTAEERDILSLWHGNQFTVDLIAARLDRSPHEVRAMMARLTRRHNADREARLRSRQFHEVLGDDSA